MPNNPITLNHDAQQDHLLLDLCAQLHAVSKALGDLSDMTTDPTYRQSDVDDLVLKQQVIMARIEEVKADQPFKYPSDTQIAALGQACDQLAQIDAATATAQQIVTAANAVVSALPVSSTKP